MHVFNLVSILAAISHVLANPPHGSEQSAKVVACETSLKLLSMRNKAFRDNEKVADECQSPPFMFLFRTSDRPEIVELRAKNVNRTDIEEPKINEPGYRALVEENVKASESVRRIVTNPIINPSFVRPDSLVVRLERPVIPLTSSASPYPPSQRGYCVHYSSRNLLPDIPPHLSPSPPAPMWDTPVTPSFGCQLLLPPSTSVVTVIKVVSLAIGATAGVGITFGVGRITRWHVKRKFDVWRLLARVRAAAARRGGVESRSVVSSGGNTLPPDADSVAMAASDYFQLGAKSRERYFTGYPSGQCDHLQRDIDEATSRFDNLMHACQHLIDEHDPALLLFLLLSRFCSAPLPRHYAITHQVLRYLKGTKYFRLHSTLDLWRYRMGPGEPATLAFLKFVTDSVTFVTGRPLIHCEPCIFGRQAHLPAPTSSTPRATTLLELIYLNICGPGRKPDISHLHVWGTCCFAMVMGYPPGERGYRNIHFVFTSMHDYSTLPFLGWCDSHTPAVTALPHDPSNLEGRPSHLDTED